MSDNKEPKFRPKHLTIEDIKKGCITLTGADETETTLCMIQEEFRQGINEIQSFTPSVTFYGSARLGESHADYNRVKSLAYRIGRELKYNILSGGGGGIMEAANKGGYEGGVRSVGLTIRLPSEQKTNEYVTDEIPFYFFFARQVAMSYATEVCIFCPGGFGTLDELFEMITLQQTRKIGIIPIILFGTEFWKPIEKMIREVLLEKYGTISSDDMNLFMITDDENHVLEIIKASRVRDGKDSLI